MRSIDDIFGDYDNLYNADVWVVPNVNESTAILSPLVATNPNVNNNMPNIPQTINTPCGCAGTSDCGCEGFIDKLKHFAADNPLVSLAIAGAVIYVIAKR